MLHFVMYGRRDHGGAWAWVGEWCIVCVCVRARVCVYLCHNYKIDFHNSNNSNNIIIIAIKRK